MVFTVDPGGTPDVVMCGPVNKAKVSAFSGNVTRSYNINESPKPAPIIAAADVIRGKRVATVEELADGRYQPFIPAETGPAGAKRLVLCSGIMAGPKAIYARGGPGAKMGALRLKGIPVAYCACHSGMSHCVLGTNRDQVRDGRGPDEVGGEAQEHGQRYAHGHSLAPGRVRLVNLRGRHCDASDTSWVSHFDRFVGLQVSSVS